ncbi:MAG: phosphotransferase [Proteobacteria bacterium]|nr:phosphotransferase [Pseudomonadota bacterium]
MTISILRPAAITPEWLTAVLRSAGVDAEVGGFAMKNVGTGQIGESVRFTLDYTRAAPGAPASLVGKFPSPQDDSRNTGIALGNYIREVNFYKHLAPTALISTPKVWFTEVDPETSEFVLMMEDLSPAEQGDQLKGCTLDQARLAVREAANLHASHWGDAAIEDLAWVSGTRAAGQRGSADPNAIRNLWQMFCARYDARLSDDARRVGNALIDNFDTYNAYYKGPKSLVHIDYRPDNMMFASAKGGRPFTMLDWQSLAFGPGVTDVTYFIAGALPRDQRRAVETELVREYHERLKELGVRDYDFDTLWRDYRSRAFALFTVAFYASVLVQQTARGDDMFMAMIKSATDQILDLDALDFLR